MQGEFSGKTVFITGAARGLGRAAARMFADKGANLFLVDVLGDLLEETRVELAGKGCDCRALAVNLADRQACFDAVAKAVEAYGRLDVLANVAGIVRFNRVPDVPAEEWALLIAVNLSAPFFLSQAAIPHLLKTHGNIVNVTSQAGAIGCAFIAPYAATKGAMVQLTRSMAMEYMKQPIRINAVAPGTMNTGIGEGVTRMDDIDMELLARYSGLRERSEPEDVAELLVFVASDRARAIHGAILHADGGVTAG
jgi:NAD(P)-dependent dehydrogenase (short-subunit alcohol dehydrogenase family)